MTIYPKTLMLLGSGELGKEFVIAAKRLGLSVIACDRYENAPAMQIADKYEVFDMSNPKELKDKILKHMPDLVIPEIEALAVDSLIEVEQEGIQIIPNARATAITMNRDKIRNLASKDLGIKTARFAYASSLKELEEKAKSMDMPIFIKPIMSSSGKGQSLVEREEDIKLAWKNAIEKSRGSSTKVIIEEYIKFDLEITLLTIREKNGSILFCPPIGHEQVNGDYQTSWQPAEISENSLNQAKDIAKKIINNIEGTGIFGIEFFIRGEDVIFSELSPRPHDTGLVTLISQNYNEFELHLKAILGIPIHEIKSKGIGASHVILSDHEYDKFKYSGIEKALSEPNTELLIFGKPNAKINRRMGVALALGNEINEACLLAKKAASCVKIIKE